MQLAQRTFPPRCLPSTSDGDVWVRAFIIPGRARSVLVSRCNLFTSSTYLLQRHILPVGVPQTAYRPTCHHLRPPDVGTFPLIFVISSTLPLHNYLCHCFDSYLPYLLLCLCVLIQISEIVLLEIFAKPNVTEIFIE